MDPRATPRAYHAAVRAWCGSRLHASRTGPWVLGIQGPQGCGKSTLAAAIVDDLGRRGARVASVSIDDFYLTHDEQLALAARYPGNPYLLYRGYPGTHDVALGARVLDDLVALRAGQETLVPVYDKSAHAGRGDRAPRSRWRRVACPPARAAGADGTISGPLDAVLVEGWMLGFSPVDEASLDEPLRAPNALLAAYAAWHEKLDSFVQLGVESLDTVVRWRVGSERARRERGETALSDEDARDYVERFLPAYRVWVPRLRAHPPCADVLSLMLGEDRLPLAWP